MVRIQKQKSTVETPLLRHKPNYRLWALRNTGVLAVVCLLSWLVFQSLEGYRWVYKDLLAANMKMIWQFPNLTQDQKYEIKLGASYKFLRTVKENTPEDAVLLYPPTEAFFPKGEKSPFAGGEPNNKLWALRFLYPRKLVLDSEFEKSPYRFYVNYVVIVNGWGYDRVPPEMAVDREKAPFAICPVKAMVQP